MNRRNILSFAILACAVLSVTANSAAQNVKAPFTLTLSAKTYEFRVGSKVWITITQTNVTDHSIDCHETVQNGVDISYFYDMKDESGNQSEKVVRPHMELEPQDYHPCNLAAGQSLTGETQISRVYKFDRAGKYVIQVSRYASSVPDDPDHSKVFSNTVTITITG
jgi:hypothetical protein